MGVLDMSRVLSAGEKGNRRQSGPSLNGRPRGLAFDGVRINVSTCTGLGVVLLDNLLGTQSWSLIVTL